MCLPQQHAWVRDSRDGTPKGGLILFLQLQKLQACPPVWQETRKAGTGTAGSSAGRSQLPGQGDQHPRCAGEPAFFATMPHGEGVAKDEVPAHLIL